MVGMPQIPGQEVLPFILLGAISGIGAPLFLKFLDLSKRQFQRTGLSLPARRGLGGLFLVLLLMAIPDVSGHCYTLVHFLFPNPWAVTVVCLFLGSKIVVPHITACSPACGGF